MNMKKAITRFLDKIEDCATKVCKSVKKHALAIAASIATVVPASAVMTVAASVDEEGLIKNVLGIIFKLFRYIGILLLAWSIGMLVLAFKNEDADSKSRSIMMMVVSVVLITVETIFTGLNLI